GTHRPARRRAAQGREAEEGGADGNDLLIPSGGAHTGGDSPWIRRLDFFLWLGASGAAPPAKADNVTRSVARPSAAARCRRGGVRESVRGPPTKESTMSVLSRRHAFVALALLAAAACKNDDGEIGTTSTSTSTSSSGSSGTMMNPEKAEVRVVHAS